LVFDDSLDVGAWCLMILWCLEVGAWSFESLFSSIDYCLSFMVDRLLVLPSPQLSLSLFTGFS
jgi:hypothetical protein